MSDELVTGLSSTAISISPGFIPALSAGPDGYTPAISAPLVLVSLNDSANSFVRSRAR